MILNLNAPSGEVIYHYTTFNAVKSILLESRSLWLSHNSCLNDLSEGILGVQKIIAFLKSQGAINDTFTFLDDVQKSMESAMREEGYYVISFCDDGKNGDSLSQWRAYASDGCGVSLGINFKELSRLCNSKGFPYIIGHCAYSIDEGVPTLMRITSFLQEGFSQEYSLPLTVIGASAAFLKHPGFREEKEYRIVTGPNVDKKYRKIGDRIITYHELTLGDDYSWLKEIVVGPCHQQIAIGKAIEAILDALKIDSKGKVRYSEIPYRSLKYY